MIPSTNNQPDFILLSNYQLWSQFFHRLVSYLDIFRKSEESIVLSAPGIVQGDLFINNSRKMHESILLMAEIWLSRNCPSSTKFAAKVHIFKNKLWFPLTTIFCHVSIMQQMYTGPGVFCFSRFSSSPFFSKNETRDWWKDPPPLGIVQGKTCCFHQIVGRPQRWPKRMEVPWAPRDPAPGCQL